MLLGIPLSQTDKAIGTIQFVFLFMLIVLSAFVILYYQVKLQNPDVKEKIGYLYTDINTERKYWGKYYTPGFSLRQFIFICIGAFLFQNEGIQIQFLLHLHLNSAFWYLTYVPHTFKIRQYYETINNWFVMCGTYQILLFTKFCYDPDM